WDLAWLYRYTNGGLTLTPGIGVEWNSENQNDYYYGVSRKESSITISGSKHPGFRAPRFDDLYREMSYSRRLITFLPAILKH
ncbi:MipA/OmpV family protein, partial [Salmonella enterica subsp. enterica serovar Montevideo]|nr:MipA/OmpV family protein [Salmonella enterica subsp. enterica serovar Montevideo]